MPLLLIRGRQSDLVSEETARAFVQQIPGAEFVDVADARHMVRAGARERGPGVCLADSTSTCRGYACVPRRVDSRVQVAGDSNDVFSSALIAFLDRKIPEAQRHFRKYTSARPKL